MNSFAFAMCLFLNVMLLGVCGYMYLVWLQYWNYVRRRDHRDTQSNIELNDFRREVIVDYFDDPSTRTTVPPKPNQLSMNDKSPRLFLHRNTYDDVGRTRLLLTKTKIIAKLRQALFEQSNSVHLDHENPYNVKPREFKTKHQDLLCDLYYRLSTVRTVSAAEATDELRPYIPKMQLFTDNKRYNNCAIVTSAGSLRDAKLGRFIDQHEVVLRFNNAPTKRYEYHVGSKTTIRILNSQVVSKPEYNLLNSSLYQNVKLLVWDPSNYSSTIQEWLQKPEHMFINSYIQFRSKYPSSNFHILDPSTLWILWDYLKGHTSVKIKPNPPSSGFLGMALLLPHCATVNVMGYVPTDRATDRCHYYERQQDPQCTYGAWHPLAAEKLIALAVNAASDRAVFYDGYVTVPGYRTITC